MEKYEDIRSNLVFTKHGKDNLYGQRKGTDRSDITIHQIVLAIQKGVLSFCGHKRFGKTYKGVKVIYKKDAKGKYVVITYYHTPRNNYKKYQKNPLRI